MVALFVDVYRSQMESALNLHGITGFLDAFRKFDKAYLAALKEETDAIAASLPVK
jgi:hypothetical protein